MSGETILVIDDMERIGSAINEELGTLGFDVDYTVSGSEALKMAAVKKYDLIFVDMHMPNMDGIETCKKLKDISPASVPIFMTGEFDENLAKHESDFVEAGGRVYFLYKPFEVSELVAVAKRALEERKLS